LTAIDTFLQAVIDSTSEPYLTDLNCGLDIASYILILVSRTPNYRMNCLNRLNSTLFSGRLMEILGLGGQDHHELRG
jgi:hypothetical protein